MLLVYCEITDFRKKSIYRSKLTYLKDLLVKSKLPSRQGFTKGNKRDKVGFKPCNRSCCPVYEQMGKNSVEEVIISATGEKMRIKDKLTSAPPQILYT